MEEQSQYYIRKSTKADKEFILSLLPRLLEFGPPDWREETRMTAVDTKILSEKLEHQPADTAIFIACDHKNIPLGFIHLHSGQDYYYHRPHAHISDIIVSPEGEGKGIGSMLIEKAESWARSQGYTWLTLNVFSQNIRARKVYERLGFEEDAIKYVKVLGD